MGRQHQPRPQPAARRGLLHHTHRGDGRPGAGDMAAWGVRMVSKARGSAHFDVYVEARQDRVDPAPPSVGSLDWEGRLAEGEPGWGGGAWSTVATGTPSTRPLPNPAHHP